MDRSTRVCPYMQGVAIAILASVMPPELKYDASVHEKLMPISGNETLTGLQSFLDGHRGQATGMPACHN